MASDHSDRDGFDSEFLGPRVSLPALDGIDTVLLPYTHFSVLMRPDKRLAAVTGLGIDGGKLMDLGRSGIPWKLDPRLPEDQQTGARVYAGNDIDRGHLVRRASAVWGDTHAEAAQANEDTFHYTNAAPQAAKFNQGLELWLGLESNLLDNAADHRRRLLVFTGPYSPAPYSPAMIPCTGAWGSRYGSSNRRIPPQRHVGSNRVHRGPDIPAGRPAGRATAGSSGRRSPARPVPDLSSPDPGHRCTDRTRPDPDDRGGPHARTGLPARMPNPGFGEWLVRWPKSCRVPCQRGGTAVRESGFPDRASRVLVSGARNCILSVPRTVSTAAGALRFAFAIVPFGISSGCRSGLFPHGSAFAVIPFGVSSGFRPELVPSCSAVAVVPFGVSSGFRPGLVLTNRSTLAVIPAGILADLLFNGGFRGADIVLLSCRFWVLGHGKSFLEASRAGANAEASRLRDRGRTGGRDLAVKGTSAALPIPRPGLC